ncbi:MAG: hypothetical protein IPG85_17395 [Bacteroidetes bacterium]|nr:hypothetical protein [Bacteroidota bacterium]
MIDTFKKKMSLGSLFFISTTIALGCWVIYRSFILEMTNDEAYSFFNLSTRHLQMMIGTANTHWLNSFFILAETTLLGNKEWMIRIHSCLGFFIFSWALFQLFKSHIKYPIQLLLPITLILLNTYLLDFFSLARGYGISLAFELAACYYISIQDESFQHKCKIYTLLCLATLSCYTCIFILFAYFIHDVLSMISKGQLRLLFSVKNMLAISPFILTASIAIPNILFIKKKGDLGEGQRNGFISDTLSIFFQRSYGEIIQSTSGIYFALFLFILVVSFYFIYRKKMDERIKILFELFFIILLLIEFLYITMDTPYVFGRTALYIDLLFLILITYIFIFISSKQSKKQTAFFSLLLFGLSLFYFIKYKNHHTTIEWWKSQGVYASILYLQKTTGNQLRNKKLGMHLAQYGAYVNYYKYLYHPPLNDTVLAFRENESGKLDTNTIQQILALDYAIMLKPYNQYLNDTSYQLLKHYPDMNSDLIKLRK